MPITISRATGAVISAPQITQEQRDVLWEALLRAYLARHPETMTEEAKK